MNFLSTAVRRRVLFAALYLSEGAPIGFVWWYLPTRLRAAGVPIEQITALTAMLVIPWTFKWAWAPLVDTLRGPRFGRRQWIMSAQLIMGASLLPLLWVDLVAGFELVFSLLLLHAIAAATQDVAIDALAISSTSPSERGAINGWMQAGMLLGRSAFGGIALILDQALGTQVVITALIATVWGSLILVAFAREPQSGAAVPGRQFLETLRGAARRPSTWWGLGFALVSAAAFEAVGAVAGPFLIDRGLAQADVGKFLALPAVAAMLLGALAGGVLGDRLPRRRAMGGVIVLTATVVLALAAWTTLSPGGADAGLLVALGALYLCIGVFTAISYALFMDLTDPRLGATQFSAYMGATNACEAWSTFAVGRLAAGFGYALAFAAMAVASLVALPLLARIGRTASGDVHTGDTQELPGDQPGGK